MAARYEFILFNSLSRSSLSEISALIEHPDDVVPEAPPAMSTAHPPPKDLTVMRRVVITVLEFPRALLSKSKLNFELIYASAYVGMTCISFDKDLLRLSENVFQWLQETLHVNLQPELDYCASIQAHGSTAGCEFNITRNIDGSQSADGQHPFEICEICGEIIPWTSWAESQCTKGHGFGK